MTLFTGRFSECWQFLSDYPGSEEQQEAVLSAFHLEHGTDQWRYMKRLDHAINALGRSYLTFGFLPQDMFPPNMLAVAGRTGINMVDLMAPSAVGDLALHELSHVGDKLLLTSADRLKFMGMAGIDPNLNTWNFNVQETYADAGRDWWLSGGLVWRQLTPILTGEAT